MTVSTLLNAKATTGAGASFAFNSNTGLHAKAFAVKVAGTGAVTATVLVEVSNEGTIWDTLVTFTLSGTTVDHAKCQTEGSWAYYRGNVSAITGTDAAVTLTSSR